MLGKARWFERRNSEKPAGEMPYLPLKSKTGAGVKSIPYSLFGVAGAAVGLQAVKQKADELQKKFREAGLSQ